MKTTTMMAVAAMVAGMTLGVRAATEVTWIGGATGDYHDAANWDGGVVPNSSTVPYIAVFTNSVQILTSKEYSNNAGFKVAANCTVAWAAGKTGGYAGTMRFDPCTKCEDNEFVVEVGEGGEFSTTAVFYGNTKITFVKKGSGTYSSNDWFGNGTKNFGGVDVQAGMFIMGGREYRLRVNGTVRIRNGATFKCNHSPVCATDQRPTTFQIDEGGTLDCNSKNQNIEGLTGSGLITNVNELRLNAGVSGCTFAGTIDSGKVIIRADANTPAGAYFTIGATNVLAGATLTVEPTAEGCNPVDLRFAAKIGTFYIVTIPEEPYFDVEGNRVEFAYTPNWFVDQSVSASGDGKSKATAFKTIKEGLDAAKASDGKVVHVYRGTYENENMADETEVVIPNKVKLIGVEGAENTIIKGKSSDDEVVTGSGCGPGAMRCVSLGSSVLLKGFKLQGGRTVITEATKGGFGGGVTSSSSSTTLATGSIIEDCIFDDCRAVRGAAFNEGSSTYTTILRRCLINNCNPTYIGSVNYGVVYNSVFANNTSYCTLNSLVRNCTYLSSNSSTHPAYFIDGKRNDISNVVNSVFLTAGVLSTNIYSYCAFKTGPAALNLGEGSLVDANLANSFDAAGKQLVGAPTIDVGSWTAYTNNYGNQGAAMDGGQRVYNQTIDMGAYEYTPTNEFMTALGNARRCELDYVSENVTTNATGTKLELTNGTKMIATLKAVSVPNKFTLNAAVTGEGTLTIKQGTTVVATVTSASESPSVTLPVTAANTIFQFDFVGSGTATLDTLAGGKMGFLIIFK